MKRGVNLVLGNYRYKKDGKYSAKQHWRCVVTRSGCRGQLHTIGEDDNIQVVHQVEHNHMADKEKTAMLQTKARLCELAEQQPVVPLPEIFRNMMAETPRADDDIMAPAFTSCRTQMHRARRQNMPELPKEIKNIQLEGEWATTLAGSDFLLHKDDKMIILSTDSNFKILTQSDTAFMDGTFKSFPSYLQSTVLHPRLL